MHLDLKKVIGGEIIAYLVTDYGLDQYVSACVPNYSGIVLDVAAGGSTRRGRDQGIGAGEAGRRHAPQRCMQEKRVRKPEMDNSQMDYATLTGAKSQGRIDAENLDLLALFHYILGAVIALFSSFFIFHIVMGIRLIQHPNAFPFAVTPSVPTPAMPSPTFPPEAGYMFAVMGSIVVLGGWALGALTAFAGRCLKARKNYVFIQVIAGLICVFVTPLGTILGVFTFIVLARPTVKALFGR